MKPLLAFIEGQRVCVLACLYGRAFEASMDLDGCPFGTVRQRLTKTAWVELDKRITRKPEHPDPHPFPDAGSYRANYVLVLLHQCLDLTGDE